MWCSLNDNDSFVLGIFMCWNYPWLKECVDVYFQLRRWCMDVFYESSLYGIVIQPQSLAITM